MTITPEQAYDALEVVSRFVVDMEPIIKDEHRGTMLEATQGAVESMIQIAREYIMLSHPDKLKTWP